MPWDVDWRTNGDEEARAKRRADLRIAWDAPQPPLFVLGMRRSGTSMLRRLLEMAPGVRLWFEPRDIWWAIAIGQQPQFLHSIAHRVAIARLEAHLYKPAHKYRGAKFAFDPGLDAMSWRWLELRFNQPRYVFIKRKLADTYASFVRKFKDEPRGVPSLEGFAYFYHLFYQSLEDFADLNPDRAVLLQYEDVVQSRGAALAPAWNMLGIKDAPRDEITAAINMPVHTAGFAEVAV